MVAEYVAVPKLVIDRNKTVALAGDVFFVDGTGFLMTVSRNNHGGICCHLYS